MPEKNEKIVVAKGELVDYGVKVKSSGDVTLRVVMEFVGKEREVEKELMYMVKSPLAVTFSKMQSEFGFNKGKKKDEKKEEDGKKKLETKKVEKKKENDKKK